MILVTGATGQTGGELVRRLSARGVPVRALVRNATKAAALSALPHVEVVEGDMMRPETLVPALRGVERAMLISSSVPDMYEVQASFIDAAVLSAGPMPWPVSRYHAPFAFSRSIPDAFQSFSSAMCVPLLSPRDTNGACAASILFNASVMSLVPPTFAGSLFGPISTKSLYITG